MGCSSELLTGFIVRKLFRNFSNISLELLGKILKEFQEKGPNKTFKNFMMQSLEESLLETVKNLAEEFLRNSINYFLNEFLKKCLRE